MWIAKFQTLIVAVVECVIISARLLLYYLRAIHQHTVDKQQQSFHYIATTGSEIESQIPFGIWL